MGRVSDWLRRRVRDPLVAELRQGATPEAVSAAVTVSLAIAINPFIGTTTLGCLVAGRLFRLNHVVMQTVNFLSYPLQLFLILPFLRVGETLTGAERLVLSPVSLALEFSKSPGDFFEKFGKAILLSSLGWALCAPPALWALNGLLRVFFRKTAARFQ